MILNINLFRKLFMNNRIKISQEELTVLIKESEMYQPLKVATMSSGNVELMVSAETEWAVDRLKEMREREAICGAKRVDLPLFFDSKYPANIILVEQFLRERSI
jgi:hypothetical protein